MDLNGSLCDGSFTIFFGDEHDVPAKSRLVGTFFGTRYVLIQGQFTNKKKGNDSYNVICHSEPSPSVQKPETSVGLGFFCTWMFRTDCADNPQKRITPGLCGSLMIYDAMSIVWSSGDPFFTTDEIDGIWTHVPDVFFWRFGLMKNHGCHCLTMERWYLPAVKPKPYTSPTGLLHRS